MRPEYQAANSCNQSAAADRDKYSVQIGNVPLELEPDRCLPQHGLYLIEGVHRHRSGLGDECFAGSEGVSITIPAHNEVGAIFANSRDLRWRGYVGDEDLGPYSEPLRRERHSCPMVATRCSRYPGRRYRAHERISRTLRAP